MKRTLFLSCVFVLLAGNALAQSVPSRSAWQAYTVSGEEFSVALPALPAMDSENRFVRRLQSARMERQIGAYADGVAYVIYTYENPKPQQTLEQFIEERKSRNSPPVVAERAVTVNGFAGKAFEREASVHQFFATDKHLYSFAAIGAPANDPRVIKFFSSLTLGKTRAGKEVSDGPGRPAEPDTSADDAATIYTSKDVDKKARLAMKPEPRYTEPARMNAITGVVVLKCAFNANGMVTNISAVSGLSFGLTEQSIKAARKIRFVPAMKDGKYVSTWMQLEYHFNLY